MKSSVLLIASILSLLACSSVEANSLDKDEKKITLIEKNACWLLDIGVSLRIGEFSQAEGRRGTWIIFRGKDEELLGRYEEVYANITQNKEVVATIFSFDIRRESVIIDQDGELNVFVTMKTGSDQYPYKKYKVSVSSRSEKLPCFESGFWGSRN